MRKAAFAGRFFRWNWETTSAPFFVPGRQSGITAIAKLREAHGAIAAFVMSGDTAPERLREAHESGLRVVHKPIQPTTLRAMVNRFLKSGHA